MLTQVLERYFSFPVLPLSHRYGQLKQNMVGILQVAKTLVTSVVEALNSGFVTEENGEKIPVTKDQIIEFFLNSGQGNSQFNQIEKTIGESLQNSYDVNKMLENIDAWINQSANTNIDGINLQTLLTMSPQEVMPNLSKYQEKITAPAAKQPIYTGPERRKVKRGMLENENFVDAFYRISGVIKQYRMASLKTAHHVLGELSDERIEDVIEVFDIYSDNFSDMGKLNGFIAKSLKAYKTAKEDIQLSNQQEEEIKLSNQ